MNDRMSEQKKEESVGLPADPETMALVVEARAKGLWLRLLEALKKKKKVQA